MSEPLPAQGARDEVGDGPFDRGVQREMGLGAGDPGKLKDLLQHVVEVLVRSGHDAQMEVAGAGHGVHLQHLADGVEARQDLGVAALRDLDGRKRENTESGRRAIDVGAEADDHPLAGQAIESRLHRSSRHVESPGHLHHGQVRRRAQQADQAGVEFVQAITDHFDQQHWTCTVGCYAICTEIR